MHHFRFARQGYGFQWVCCGNYLWETCAWVIFSILTMCLTSKYSRWKVVWKSSTFQFSSDASLLSIPIFDNFRFCFHNCGFRSNDNLGFTETWQILSTISRLSQVRMVVMNRKRETCMMYWVSCFSLLLGHVKRSFPSFFKGQLGDIYSHQYALDHLSDTKHLVYVQQAFP